jgi:hypothetical protein
MFIIKRLVEALSAGEQAVLSSDPSTYALVHGGNREEIEVALYHLYLYMQPIVVANTFLSSQEFMSWADKEFSLSETFIRCGRGDILGLRYGFRRQVIINGTQRPVITFNS